MNSAVMPASEPCVLPLASITVIENFNPRRAFRVQAFNELVESIRKDGLIQAITVRRLAEGDGYALIAGERRLRACKSLGYTEIPALIRDCDEATARLLALRENTDRDDLTAAEEAVAARAAFDLCGQDAASTAKQLGWSLHKLQSRLLLLSASPAVLDAVNHERILVGHAELLAGLPFDAQDKLCERIVAQAISVAQLREQLQGVLIPLSRAIFDLTGCAECPNNSAHQRSLFGDGLEGAFCKNRACFNDKTSAALESKRQALREDFQTVALDSEKDPASYTPLSADGATGVGVEQFAACRQCQHYGALIHDKPDGRQGTVAKPLCFSVACNREKIEARRKAEAQAKAPPQAKADSATETTPPAPRAGGHATSTPATARPATKAGAATAAASTVSNATRKLMIPAYRNAARGALAADPRYPLVLSIFGIEATMRESRMRFQDAPHGDALRRLAALSAMQTDELLRLYRERLDQMLSLDGDRHTNSSLFHSASAAATLCQINKVSLAEHFRMSSEYLTSLTREGIASVLDESGFSGWQRSQPDGDATLKRMLAAKKSECITQIMASGFDWTGYVPSAVSNVVPRALDEVV